MVDAMQDRDYSILEPVDLSGEYVDVIEQFTPVIQENIVSAFNNEMARNHRRKDFIKTVHNLDTILLSLDNTKIELSNLKLPWLPDFKVIHLGVNLCKLCLDIDFKLGDLTVGGNYEANNVVLQKVLPVSSIGNISVKFSEVSVKGRVGLLIQGDSFVPENYDVDYSWNETEIAVSYFVDKEVRVENRITSSEGEQAIADAIWLQLREILTTILREQLKSVVIEYSVQESMADEDEKLREFARYQSAKADGLFDTLLCSAKDYLVAKDLRSIATPTFDVIYRGKLSSTETGLFQSGPGYISDLTTLSRLTDLSLFEDNGRLLVYGTLGLREFKHGYEKFTTKFEDNELSGSLRAQIHVTEIFVKLSFEKNEGEGPQKTKIEKIETRLLGNIETDSTGLGSLSWLIPRTRSWLLGHLRSVAMETLLKTVEEAFEHAIADEIKKAQVEDREGEKTRMFWQSIFSK